MSSSFHRSNRDSRRICTGLRAHDVISDGNNEISNGWPTALSLHQQNGFQPWTRPSGSSQQTAPSSDCWDSDDVKTTLSGTTLTSLSSRRRSNSRVFDASKLLSTAVSSSSSTAIGSSAVPGFSIALQRPAWLGCPIGSEKFQQRFFNDSFQVDYEKSPYSRGKDTPNNVSPMHQKPLDDTSPLPQLLFSTSVPKLPMQQCWSPTQTTSGSKSYNFKSCASAVVGQFPNDLASGSPVNSELTYEVNALMNAVNNNTNNSHQPGRSRTTHLSLGDKQLLCSRFLAFSTSTQGCEVLKNADVLSLLIEMLFPVGESGSFEPVESTISSRVNEILRNIFTKSAEGATNSSCGSHLIHECTFIDVTDDPPQELLILNHIETVRQHCQSVRSLVDQCNSVLSGFCQVQLLVTTLNKHATCFDDCTMPAVDALMRLSFKELSRQTLSTLGVVQSLCQLLELESQLFRSLHSTCTIQGHNCYELIGNNLTEGRTWLLRQICIALANLTFGDSANKTLLCRLSGALSGLVQLLDIRQDTSLDAEFLNEDVVMASASLLRNLSWKAAADSKEALRRANVVQRLCSAAPLATVDTTLRAILNALWNLSAHGNENKATICQSPGFLPFLVGMLSENQLMQLRTQGGEFLTVGSQGLTSLLEICTGVLRNVSCHVARSDAHRAVLRANNALPQLLSLLRSSSLTVVSHVCATLWNLSSRCAEDQQLLWDLGAVPMLKSLAHHRNTVISNGAAAALKNLSEHRILVSSGASVKEQLRRPATLLSPTEFATSISVSSISSGSCASSPADGSKLLSGGTDGLQLCGTWERQSTRLSLRKRKQRMRSDALQRLAQAQQHLECMSTEHDWHANEASADEYLIQRPATAGDTTLPRHRNRFSSHSMGSSSTERALQAALVDSTTARLCNTIERGLKIAESNDSDLDSPPPSTLNNSSPFFKSSQLTLAFQDSSTTEEAASGTGSMVQSNEVTERVSALAEHFAATSVAKMDLLNQMAGLLLRRALSDSCFELLSSERRIKTARIRRVRPKLASSQKRSSQQLATNQEPEKPSSSALKDQSISSSESSEIIATVEYSSGDYTLSADTDLDSFSNQLKIQTNVHEDFCQSKKNLLLEILDGALPKSTTSSTNGPTTELIIAADDMEYDYRNHCPSKTNSAPSTDQTYPCNKGTAIDDLFREAMSPSSIAKETDIGFDEMCTSNVDFEDGLPVFDMLLTRESTEKREPAAAPVVRRGARILTKADVEKEEEKKEKELMSKVVASTKKRYGIRAALQKNAERSSSANSRIQQPTNRNSAAADKNTHNNPIPARPKAVPSGKIASSKIAALRPASLTSAPRPVQNSKMIRPRPSGPTSKISVPSGTARSIDNTPRVTYPRSPPRSNKPIPGSASVKLPDSKPPVANVALRKPSGTLLTKNITCTPANSPASTPPETPAQSTTTINNSRRNGLSSGLKTGPRAPTSTTGRISNVGPAASKKPIVSSRAPVFKRLISASTNKATSARPSSVPGVARQAASGPTDQRTTALQVRKPLKNSVQTPAPPHRTSSLTPSAQSNGTAAEAVAATIRERPTWTDRSDRQQRASYPLSNPVKITVIEATSPNALRSLQQEQHQQRPVSASDEAESRPKVVLSGSPRRSHSPSAIVTPFSYRPQQPVKDTSAAMPKHPNSSPTPVLPAKQSPTATPNATTTQPIQLNKAPTVSGRLLTKTEMLLERRRQQRTVQGTISTNSMSSTAISPRVISKAPTSSHIQTDV